MLSTQRTSIDISDQDHADAAVADNVAKEVFTPYVCKSIQSGKPHPGDIAEASSLSAIPLPASNYPLWDSIPPSIVDEGRLSSLQLEGILYACTKHQEILPSGERAGFFIGDGAGVGKGRQIAGIIIDNYARGRRQHVWVSTSADLHLEAQRDLRDLGCHITVINNCQTLDRESKALGLSKDYQEGVLFLTYSTLVSSGGKGGKNRLTQVIDWLGGPSFQGCLVFDECHKAKNFTPGKEKQSTKVSAAVIKLQASLPMARVLYCSATGVSEVGNMAYMARMGLWGPSTAFASFEEFLDSMKRRGVSFMEMLAMEMKAEGKYVARGLSFRDAEFVELEAPLTSEQVQVYDDAALLWSEVGSALETALNMCCISSKDVWKAYWAAQQRFFKLLCVSMKVATVVREVKVALEEGMCCVIGLQSTGEAAAEALGLEPGPTPGFVSATKELLARFIQMHVPTHIEVAKEAVGVLVEEPPEVPECVEMKHKLLERVNALQLPANFLDHLMDALGGPKQVAEMTGRRGRIIRDSKRRTVFELRAMDASGELDSLNVREKDAFMRGEKLVAIISDAASTGISLHASRTAKNQRRRVHLTIELPWSADKAIQQLGRSHRSNQVAAPIYKLVSTQIGGEKRFAAAVSRRLQSLGALTRGDRRAASGINLSEQNFDSPLGRKALRRMYDHIVQESPQLPLGITLPEIYKDADTALLQDVTKLQQKGGDALGEYVAEMHRHMRACCELMGVGLGSGTIARDTVVEEKVKDTSGKDTGDVRRFLNRLLGLPVARQGTLFGYFAATLTAEIRAARLEGRYSDGVGDLAGASINRKGPPVPLWVDPISGLKTLATVVTLDRGISFQEAVRRLETEAVPGDDSGFRRSRRPVAGRHLVLLALQKPQQRNVFTSVRPNTGESYFDFERSELEARYVRVSPEEVEEEWGEMYEGALTVCQHGPGCTAGAECQVGKRVQEAVLLSGSVVRVWGVLEAVLARNEMVLPRAERSMRVVRATFSDESQMVGVKYPASLLTEVVAMLNSLQTVNPSILSGGQRVGGSAFGISRVEGPSPVDPKSQTAAFRAPRVVTDFFKPLKAPAAGGSSGKVPPITAPAPAKRPTAPPILPPSKKPRKPPTQSTEVITILDDSNDSFPVPPPTNPPLSTPLPATSKQSAAAISATHPTLGPASKDPETLHPPSGATKPQTPQHISPSSSKSVDSAVNVPSAPPSTAPSSAAPLHHPTPCSQPPPACDSAAYRGQDPDAPQSAQRPFSAPAPCAASCTPHPPPALNPTGAAAAPPKATGSSSSADGGGGAGTDNGGGWGGGVGGMTRSSSITDIGMNKHGSSSGGARGGGGGGAGGAGQAFGGPIQESSTGGGEGVTGGTGGWLVGGGSVAAAEAPRADPRDEALSVLLGMGFSSKQADKALIISRGNLQRALDWLLSGIC